MQSDVVNIDSSDSNVVALRLNEARMVLKSILDEGREKSELELVEYLQLWIRYHQELLDKMEGWDE